MLILDFVEKMNGNGFMIIFGVFLNGIANRVIINVKNWLGFVYFHSPTDYPMKKKSYLHQHGNRSNGLSMKTSSRTMYISKCSPNEAATHHYAYVTNIQYQNNPSNEYTLIWLIYDL